MNEEILKEKSIQLAPVLFASLFAVNEGKGFWAKDYNELSEVGKSQWIDFARAVIVVSDDFANPDASYEKGIKLALLKEIKKRRCN